MSSPIQALILGGDGANANPAFVQQGQVDWVSFGNTVYSASLATMQRLASAGIQPVTHGAGLALASQFRLPEIGRRRMEDALQKLKVFYGYERILYFGFGVQSFVRLFQQSQMGVNCIALCSCLADYHSEELVAWTLMELWRVLKFLEEFEPSHVQFRALVKACSGVVASTTFGATISVMLGRSQTSWYLGYGTASGAKDIANVLDGLFKLSRGMRLDLAIGSVGGRHTLVR